MYKYLPLNRVAVLLLNKIALILFIGNGSRSFTELDRVFVPNHCNQIAADTAVQLEMYVVKDDDVDVLGGAIGPKP